MGERDFRNQPPDERRRLTPMTFLRSRIRVVVRRYEPRTVIHWSPSINLQAIESLGERYRGTMEHTVERSLERRVREREEIVLRLTREKTRLESVSAAALPANAELKPYPAAPRAADPPAMLLRQQPKPVTAAESIAAQPPVRFGAFASPGSAGAPIDVDRVTDQVMEKIDRRLMAQRERLWRK